MKINAITSDDTVTVFRTSENSNHSSTASANFVGNYWFINRVLVNPKSHRGQGIGSQLLQTLIKEIKKINDIKIIVTPGGYENDQERQNNFYTKNGFVEEEDCFTHVNN